MKAPLETRLGWRAVQTHTHRKIAQQSNKAQLFTTYFACKKKNLLRIFVLKKASQQVRIRCRQREAVVC